MNNSKQKAALAQQLQLKMRVVEGNIFIGEDEICHTQHEDCTMGPGGRSRYQSSLFNLNSATRQKLGRALDSYLLDEINRRILAVLKINKMIGEILDTPTNMGPKINIVDDHYNCVLTIGDNEKLTSCHM